MDTSAALERFGALPFTIEAELGSLALTIAEILTLREGTVLQTDHPAGTPFVLRAGGIELAAAEAVVIDDTLAMRVKALCQKNKPGVASDGTD